MTEITTSSEKLFNKVIELLDDSRASVIRNINSTMVLTYFEIGKMIVEEEQDGKERANYGESILSDLSKRLMLRFGKGFSEVNLRQMRAFYQTYSIQQTVSAKFNLSWSHYLKLMRIQDLAERRFYEIESYKNNWSLRELQRQYDSALYTRLALSREKEQVLELSTKGQIIQKPKDAIKDPYILEFIGLPENTAYSEFELAITLPENNEQIFASKYQTVLPSKDELKNLLRNS